MIYFIYTYVLYVRIFNLNFFNFNCTERFVFRAIHIVNIITTLASIIIRDPKQVRGLTIDDDRDKSPAEWRNDDREWWSDW